MKGTLKIPTGLNEALGMTQDAFLAELMFMAAAKYYELGRMSSGKAAELAGIGKVVFIHKLAEIGVPILNLDEEHALLEMETAKRLAEGSS